MQCKHSIQFTVIFTFLQYWHPKCCKFTVVLFCTIFIQTFQCKHSIQFAVTFTFLQYWHPKCCKFTVELFCTIFIQTFQCEYLIQFAVSFIFHNTDIQNAVSLQLEHFVQHSCLLFNVYIISSLQYLFANLHPRSSWRGWCIDFEYLIHF